MYLGWNWQGGIVHTPAIFNEVVIDEYPNVYPLDAPITITPIEISAEASRTLESSASEIALP